MSFLLNGTREVVANTFEVLSVHVDLTQRRSVAFDPDTMAALDRVVRAHAGLRWPAPVSGALRLR
jgi:acyl-CoA thioester hydrolase